MVVEKEPGGLQDVRIGIHRDHIPRHDVSGFQHGISSLFLIPYYFRFPVKSIPIFFFFLNLAASGCRKVFRLEPNRRGRESIATVFFW
jgi:hypothetical protein